MMPAAGAKKYTLEALQNGFLLQCPPQAENFWSILEAFLYQKYAPEYILDAKTTLKSSKFSAAAGKIPYREGIRTCMGIRTLGFSQK